MAAPSKSRAFDPVRDLQLGWTQKLAELDALARQKQRELEAKTRALVAKYAASPVVAKPPPPRAKPPSGWASRAMQSRAPDPAARLKEEARASGSGFVDGISAGTADYLSAAFKVALGQGGAGNLIDRYGTQLAAEREQDRYDRVHFGGARLVGQGAGTVAGIGLTGGALGGLSALRGVAALQAAGRLAPNFGHVARVGAAAGGAMGVTGQAVGDSISGEISDPGKYGGAALGGALAGAAAPVLGVGRAATLAGAATPWLQSAAASEAPNPVELALGAALAPVGVGRVDAGAAAAFNRLPIKQKQQIGERLSLISSATRGETPLRIQTREYLDGGGYTVADHVTNKHVVEAKAGARAQLSGRQRQAQRELEGGYLVEHWLPRDFGSMAAMSLVGLGAPIIQVPAHLMLSARTGE